MNIKRYLKNPFRLFAILANKGLFNWLQDEAYLKLRYKAHLGVWPDLQNPKTFNEKLQWLKLNYRDPMHSRLVDKYEVKKYIEEQLDSEYIIPTLGVWGKFEDIDFDALPNQFVLKCTHDSGGLAICRDKGTFDKKSAKEKIDRSLACDYSRIGREWPYKNVKPRIIAEQYMEENATSNLVGLTDYKFYCFHGEPKFLYVSRGLEDHSTAEISFLSLDWQFLPFKRSDYKPLNQLPPQPKNFQQMLAIAAQLSQNIPFVRVDLYEISGKIYFSELTFSPCSGMIPFEPQEWDEKLGDLLILPQ